MKIILALLLIVIFVITSCNPKSNDDINYLEVEIEMPPALKPDRFPRYLHGQKGLSDYLKKRLKSLNVDSISVENRKISVSFIVNRAGKVEEVRITQGNSVYLNNLALKAIKEMTDWKPAQRNGEDIDFIYKLPIQF